MKFKEKLIGASLFALAFIVGVLFQTWIFMLLLGAAHTFIEWVPALGFQESFISLVLLNFVGATLFSNRAVKK